MFRGGTAEQNMGEGPGAAEDTQRTEQSCLLQRRGACDSTEEMAHGRESTCEGQHGGRKVLSEPRQAVAVGDKRQGTGWSPDQMNP